MFNVDNFEGDLNKLTNQHNSWLGAAIHQVNALPSERTLAINALDDAGAGEATPEPPQTEYELGASFLVYYLDDDVLQPNGWDGSDLSQLVKDTGRRHHQLKSNGKAVAYSRTLVENDELCQLWVTEVAGAIQEGFEWLQRFEESNPEYAAADPLVRLLRVPSFGIYAFWIQKTKEGETSDVLVVWPRELDTPYRLRNTEEFLGGLGDAVPMNGLIGPLVDLNDPPNINEREEYADA